MFCFFEKIVLDIRFCVAFWTQFKSLCTSFFFFFLMPGKYYKEKTGEGEESSMCIEMHVI